MGKKKSDVGRDAFTIYMKELNGKPKRMSMRSLRRLSRFLVYPFYPVLIILVLVLPRPKPKDQKLK